METRSRNRLIASMATLLVAALFTACVHRPKLDPNINWNERIGSYTYEQALAEIGKPDVIAESSEGRTADWILKRSPQMSFGVGLGSGVYGSHVGTGVGVGTSVSPPPHGEYLHLTFDSEGKLKAWSRVKH
jgi:hypothetical protein